MKKNLTEIVFILDRSGSMAGLEDDTIGGFNAMIEKQKKEPGKAFVSTVLFDDKTEVLHDRKELDKIEPLTDKDYYVRGCTALLDGVGGAIHHIGNVHKYAREEDRPEKTLFIITTDGMENASHKYSYEDVKRCVDILNKYNITNYSFDFIYGIRNQSIYSISKDIDLCLELNPKHLSFYSLILEDNTLLKIDALEI